MQSSRTSRFLATVLVVALLIQMLPTQSFAIQNNNAEYTEQVESAAPITIVGEEITLRGEGEKHFRLSDGSFLAVTYGTPVHYMDNSGNWQEIDNRPVMTADSDGIASYQISNADKSTSFSSALTDGTLFSTSAGEYSVSMHLLDTVQAAEQYRTAHMTAGSTVNLNMSVSEEEFQVFSRNAVAEVEESVELYSTDEEQTGWKASDLMPEYFSSSIIYEDVFQGVDLRYEASGYNIKEEIIIYQPQNSYRYDFLLTLDGLSAQMNEDGSIDLFDENDVVIYEIPAPYMIDGAGEFSTAVEYSILEVEKGVILTVVADEEWINDSSREYPVTIDPSLNLAVYTSNNGEDLNMYISYVKESEPNRTAQGANPIYVGYGISAYEMTSYIYINDLPALPIGAFVTQATLNLYFTGYSNSFVPQMPLGIYEVTSGPSLEGQTYRDWIRFMTWNNKPNYDADNLIDYAVVSYSTVYTANGYQPVSWDMTELVKKWYYGNTENRTIALGSTTQYTPDKCAVSTFSAYGSSTAPMLVVSYRNNTGIEPYYTYTTLGVGAAGTAYIADGTGQLKNTKQLLGYASSVNPFSLNLIYNSDYFATSNDAEYHPMSDLGLAMSMGSGWRLDCVQKVETEVISGTTYLKYYDGDGTIHYFLKDYSRGSDYYDEDGLGLKIAITNNMYVMSDDKGNTWTFTNGFLTECADENGNKQIINYEGNRLTSVVQKNASTDTNYTGITVATFAYHDDGRLNTVTDAAGNVFTLCYAENENKLTAIMQGNTVIARYEYSGNRVTRMTDHESSYAIAFSYGTEQNNGRIVLFQEQIVTLTNAAPTVTATGATVEVEYPNYAQTTYIDYGSDRKKYPSGDNLPDDTRTCYLFDYAGRTVNAYTTDASGKILGASNAVYSGSGSTDKTNNRTMRTASIGVASQQLLTNSSFESDGGWNFGNTRGNTNPRTGGYAVSLSQDITSTQIILSATQTYTFSAYIDTSGATGFAGQGIYLKAAYSEKVWTGIPANYQTSADNKWTRISVTFTAPADGAYTFSICNDGVSGSVYADDVQLETGEAPSNYNLLENGSFSMGKNGWEYPDTVEVDKGTLKITGSPSDVTANASQTVEINLPSTETYVLSGWVTANAVPDTMNTASDPAQDTNKQCGLRAAIHYTDETVEYHYVPFNTDLSDKQFVSCTIVPNPKDTDGNPVVKTVSRIVVTCAYETNANIAYFDDISLVREATQTMKYDDDGNLVSVTTSGLNVDISSYEGGNLIKTVTGSQGIFEYDYDDTYTHRLTSVTNRASEDSEDEYITQSMGYDEFGNVTSTTLTRSGNLTMSTSAQYTNSGNLPASVTDAAGATVTYGYTDADGNADLNSVMWGIPTSVTAPNDVTTRTVYDLYGRVTQTSVADLATLVYNYSNGNLSSITRTAGDKSQTYSLQYDSFGKTTSISVGNRQLAAYEYLAGNGLLSKQTYGNGHTVSFTYDDLGRTKTVTHSDGTVLYYTYTGDGQLHSVTENLNGVSTLYLYQYDTLGNLVGSEKRVGGSPVLRTYHSYNDDNKLSAQGWQIGSDSFTQTYAYDEWDGNLSSVVLSDNDTTTNDLTVSYTYDALRRLATVSNGVFTRTYNYATTESGSATPRLESFTHSGITSPYHYEWDYSYEYENGNIVSVTHGMFTDTYVYDANNQLIRENKDRGKYTQTWEYDEFGNITATRKYAYTTGALGEPTSTVTYGYTDSDWGDLLTEYNGQDIEYDNIGNPLYVKDGDTVVKSYSWTQGRQMATHMTKGVTWSYTYDANGLRTGRTSQGNTYEYIYAGDKLVRMIYNGAVSDITYAGNQPMTLTYGGATYYYVLNGQGDVIGLTDATGKMIIGYHYGAYGTAMAVAADATLAPVLAQANPLLYRGYVYDRETSLYYLQSRYYDPEMGRFINADVYASTGQGILGNNMFAYCGNNPVIRADAGGTFFFTVLGAAIGAVVGAVDAWMMGGDTEDIIKGAKAGAWSGGIAGAGVDAGVLVVASGGTMGLALGIVAGAGALGGAVGTGVSTDWQAEPIDYFGSALLGAGLNMVSFGTAPIGGEIIKGAIPQMIDGIILVSGATCTALFENVAYGTIIAEASVWIYRVITENGKHRPEKSVVPYE